jgi:butyryl-CoA:acetate CoA-transferase
LVTADEAAKVVKSGNWIEYCFGINMPIDFEEALSKRVNELWDVNIRCDIGAYRHATLEVDETGEHFTWNSWHTAAQDKKWIGKTLFYIPMTFHENPKMTRENPYPNDVFVAQVSPMDKHGYFSFGTGAATAYAAGPDTAKTIIVEVNKNVPRALGGNQETVHISQVDMVIEGSNQPMMLLPAAKPSEVDAKIARHCIDRMRDGCCIQLGIGGVPNAVGTMVCDSDLKDIGVHTEMYVDAYLEMVKVGKVTGKHKSLDRYKQVYAFAMGTQDLYDYIDDNPGLASYPVDYTNNPYVVAQIDNFVSINACVEVDLFGQICSESVGYRHLSGTGGQLDFVAGAYKSKGGQSFVCMPSTIKKKDGTLASKIQPILTPGAIVTDPRTATHMIVTEYGVANMKGLSTWQRSEALIEIAHPDFRDELVKEAQKMSIWRKSNKR